MFLKLSDHIAKREYVYKYGIGLGTLLLSAYSYDQSRKDQQKPVLVLKYREKEPFEYFLFNAGNGPAVNPILWDRNDQAALGSTWNKPIILQTVMPQEEIRVGLDAKKSAYYLEYQDLFNRRFSTLADRNLNFINKIGAIKAWCLERERKVNVTLPQLQPGSLEDKSAVVPYWQYAKSAKTPATSNNSTFDVPKHPTLL
jgi:hypothetical protein